MKCKNSTWYLSKPTNITVNSGFNKYVGSTVDNDCDVFQRFEENERAVKLVKLLDEKCGINLNWLDFKFIYNQNIYENLSLSAKSKFI
ncbi:uncharacterized protein ASCRUDRAFT_78108 [Ascoidea rubescens DSM 1968]|uniref:Uncharacterized protein n=1 Tax=Ascoidea rubescens DSM 1968 TaxID=1344418 RepID=A0A1D2V9A3_9ASCO|nr:hypothetical protein ASCRUDRAFT_78108 [Ascoidea rubescens DSM 1968]ODV58208.1 hypothetical protein ASCRUDRAFT_78108 [Ascoidea rubescens DSM 1968]